VTANAIKIMALSWGFHAITLWLLEKFNVRDENVIPSVNTRDLTLYVLKSFIVPCFERRLGS
jgi:acetylglutamate synthase